jgi:hypothetical protein
MFGFAGFAWAEQNNPRSGGLFCDFKQWISPTAAGNAPDRFA